MSLSPDTIKVVLFALNETVKVHGLQNNIAASCLRVAQEISDLSEETPEPEKEKDDG